jgi:hypothetical protein
LNTPAPDPLDSFRDTIRRRNRREIGAGVLVQVFAIGFTLRLIWHGHALGVASWLGLGGLLMGTLIVQGTLLRLGRPVGPQDSLTAELLRQAELLSWAPLWYVLPLMLGGYGLLLGLFTDLGARLPPLVLPVVVMVGIGVAVVNLAAGKRLREAAEG